MTTSGHLLGGRVRYRQPAAGFRTGIEPVLLAAAVPARPGDRVLEAGTGAGAALLCLSARIPGLRATGVEIDPAVAALARENVADLALDNVTGLALENVTALAREDVTGLTPDSRPAPAAQIDIITGDILTEALAGPFDHALANPPYHPDTGAPSPDPGREIAKVGPDALITAWISRMAALLRHHGTLTLIIPAGRVALCLAALSSSHCPATILFPLWPKQDRPAKLVILRGIRNGRSPLRIMPGLALHRADGSYTDAALKVFNDTAPLSLHTE